MFYFKAKDVSEILEYVDTKTVIIDHVDETDKFIKDFFVRGFKGGDSPPFQNDDAKKFLEKEHPQTSKF